jgi:hypothetical protein
MSDMFNTWGAESMTVTALRSGYKRQQAAAKRYSDTHGLIGRNVAQLRASAYSFELVRRGERLEREA